MRNIKFDFKDKVSLYYKTFLNSKKYLLIYLLFLSTLFLSVISKKTIYHPKFEILTFILVVIVGILCLVYYFSHNNDKELYKVAFVVILCFGIICSFIVPIMDISDETEHLIRSEITSQGVLIPHWTGEDMGVSTSFNLSSDGKKIFNGAGYETIESMSFYSQNREITIFETTHDTDKINNSKIIFHSAFEQNPFYGYLPQAIGVLFAKLLDLNLIWIMWLGRIFNLICYAIFISIAIKKTPILKIPLLAVACIPLTIYQAASISIDSMIFGLGILAVSYFIWMCKSKNFNIKNIIIFTVICLLLGLCKLPYLSFIFLILFIPKENFKEKEYLSIYILLSIVFVSVIGILWSHYSTPALMHSWRPIETNSNAIEQINFLINNPHAIMIFIKQIFTSDLQFILNGFFNFYNGTPGAHYTDNYSFITVVLQLFLILALFLYPINANFNLKTKIGCLGTLLLVYVGTSFVQLLSWADIGKTNLGISLRYFIPLLALIPIIFSSNYNFFNKEEFDKYSIVLIVGFMSILILSFATKYY